MFKKNFIKVLMVTFSFMAILSLTLIWTATAQEYWTALPPYNTLWPLWSPVLSPVDAASGLPVPLVTSLTSSTILPVEPGLTWNTNLGYPWLLYNTPVGMAYFDPLYGVNFWPPSTLVDSSGAPSPITLPSGYNLLAPTDPLWLQQNVLFANNYFLQAYPGLLRSADPSLLLTAALSAGVPLPPAVYAALNLGIPVPALGVTILPPPALSAFLAPAALLGW